MRKVKLTLFACSIFAVVGSGLAFKSRPWGHGTVFCIDSGTSCDDLRNFTPKAGSPVTDVCDGIEFKQTNNDCIPVSGPFIATMP